MHEMRDKCIEHIENEFDLLPMSIFIIDIKIINRDLNKGYFWGKKCERFTAYRVQYDRTASQTCEMSFTLFNSFIVKKILVEIINLYIY